MEEVNKIRNLDHIISRAGLRAGQGEEETGSSRWQPCRPSERAKTAPPHVGFRKNHRKSATHAQCLPHGGHCSEIGRWRHACR